MEPAPAKSTAPAGASPTKLTQRAFLEWRLPPVRAVAGELPAQAIPEEASSGGWPNDAEFLAVGRALAAAKGRLDAIPAADFEALMRALDMYRGLKATLRDGCGLAIATNAALKMYELLGQMRLLACEAGALPRARVFCNAELPGAFLVAINHYLRTRCPATRFDWLASSFLPAAEAKGEGSAFPGRGGEAALGDQYGLYAANRGQWLMGPPPNALPPGEPPLSGDLTDASVVAALADAVHDRFGAGPEEASGALLYTSDAGIDVSADFNRQEEATALLNFGQVVCGLLALAPGGRLVTKQYTFFTRFSRELIALVAALFDEVSVTKPLTSRPVNSEVYLVGRGFRGVSPALADALLDRLAALRRDERRDERRGERREGEVPASSEGPGALGILDPALCADVDAALLRIARQVHGRQQVAFLNEAADFYAAHQGRLAALAGLFGRAARQAQESWLLENPVARIRDDQLLASKKGHAAARAATARPGPCSRGGGGEGTLAAAPKPRGAPSAAAPAPGSDSDSDDAGADSVGAEPPLVRILVKRAQGGLGVDAAVLAALLPGAEVVEVSPRGKARGPQPSDGGPCLGPEAPGSVDRGAGQSPKPPLAAAVQFHLEHFFRGYPAAAHYLFVNPEFLLDWDLAALRPQVGGRGKAQSPPTAVALCKSAHAQSVLEALGVVGARVTRFGTLAPAVASVVRMPRLFVHLAGASWMKGTLEVLRAWFELGGVGLDAVLFITRWPGVPAARADDLAYWDRLAPDRGGSFLEIGELEQKRNVFLARRPLPAAEFSRLVAAAAFHLCPSLAEGWGHIIDQGRAAGAVVITTDSPPMNELVGPESGLLVATDGSHRGFSLAELNPALLRFYPPSIAATRVVPVDPGALMRAVSGALALGPTERARLGDAARARHLADSEEFGRALRALAAGRTPEGGAAGETKSA